MDSDEFWALDKRRQAQKRLRKILAREHAYWRSFYEPDEVFDYGTKEEKDRWGNVVGERIMKTKRED